MLVEQVAYFTVHGEAEAEKQPAQIAVATRTPATPTGAAAFQTRAARPSATAELVTAGDHWKEF